MNPTTTYARKHGARGSALMVVMYMVTIMSLVLGVHFYRNSQYAAIEGQTRENEAGSQAVAEYAAEMVIANLSNMEFTEQDGVRLSVAKDWVGARPYGDSGLASAERRIAGTIDGYDYRVVVRAVREVKDLPAGEGMGAAWLTAVNPDPYQFGVDPLDNFTGAYEVIASARKSDSAPRAGSASSAQFAYDSTVRTVVNMDFSSLLSKQRELSPLSLTGPIKDETDIALGHSPGGAANLAHQNRSVIRGAGGGGGSGGGGDDGDDDDDDENAPEVTLESDYPKVENIHVSGEEHYSHKAAVKDKSDDGIIDTWATIKAQDSELFSVTNDYWDKGKMTLHYRFGDGWNPRIPRTVNFDDFYNTLISGNHNTMRTASGVPAGINQETVYRYQYEDAGLPLTQRRIVDQYIYGGKSGSYEYEKLNPLTNSAVKYRRGRSVTLDSDYRIIEKTKAEVDPANTSGDEGMASTTLAVSKYENIFNLYFTLIQPTATHSHPAPTATDHQIQTWIDNNWTFQSLGYYSEAKSKIMTSQITPAIRPLDNYNSAARRRWATLVWIKNGNGQFLVREYPADTNYENPLSSAASPTGTWYGTYRWAWYVGYNGTYKYHMGTWLETVEGYGVSSGKNYSKNINTRFLTMEELLGYKVTKGPDGLPAKLDAQGKVIGGVPDFELDAEFNRIPYDPDGSGTVFNEAYQRQASTDNFGINQTILNNPSMTPPTDGIYVRLDDQSSTDFDWQGGPKGYKYKRYKTIQDFSNVRNVANVDDGEEDDFRDITSLHMVLEITPEDPPTSSASSQDYGTLYFDMGLTVAVVYPKLLETDDDEYFLEDIFRHWWQGESEESLTGDSSQKPVYAIMDKSQPLNTPEDYYRQFGFLQARDGEEAPIPSQVKAPNIYSMLDSSGNPTGFGVARFYDEDENMGKLNPEKWGQPGDEFLFHYGQDILYDFYSFNITEYYASKFVEYIGETAYEYLAQNPSEYQIQLDNWRETLALENMTALNSDLDAGINFARMGNRFDGQKRHQAQLSVDRVMELLRVPKKETTTRYFFSQVFGFKNVQTPVVKAELRDGEIKLLDPNPPESVARRAITYMAGEKSPEMAPGSYVAPLYRDGNKQPNGRDLKPKMIWNHGTLKAMTPEEIAAAGDIEDLDTVYYYPDWFIGGEPEFLDNNLKPPLLEEYPREHRGRLGWHREGPYGSVHVPNSTDLTNREYCLTYGDAYEFVVMAEKDFVPYETVKVTLQDGTTVECVALFFSPDEGAEADEDSDEQWKPKLKAPAKMPTFVIKNDVEGPRYDDAIMGELDGSGILVVNGNLRVRSRLAYHGTIIVLGDVIVGAEDESDQVYARDKYGEIVDSKDNQLTQNATGQWGYFTGDNKDKWVESSPAKVYLGDLIVQGMLIVGGDVLCLNEKVISKGSKEPVRIPAGRIDVRASQRAITETTGTWSKAAPYEGIQVDRIGWSSGVNTTDMNMWKD